MIKDEEWLLSEKYAGNAEAPGFAADRARLAEGEPLAYVIGTQPFLGLTIHLDSHPLIPRPETEWWVEELLRQVESYPQLREARFQSTQKRKTPGGILERAERDGASQSKFSTENYAVPKSLPASGASNSLRFLDLCAGSGAIGCAALKRLPDAQVSFGEIDPAHEATIRTNIRENHLDLPAQPGESRADIRIGDLFEPFADARFDVIAANPPYIPEGRTLDPSVTEHEPHRALFAGEDGLALIRRIADGLAEHLAPHGVAWIEVDCDHADAARALFAERGFSATIRTDQYGVPRVIVVSFP